MNRNKKMTVLIYNGVMTRRIENFPEFLRDINSQAREAHKLQYRLITRKSHLGPIAVILNNAKGKEKIDVNNSREERHCLHCCCI